ncbi:MULTISPECIES: ATP-binding protein [unclassified Corynebacterium]|uniref:sensor histidine kinase n=1 Tax=unclassified Corynebacterium TaxID=2624378 RepID=UPI001C47BF61|nr:sensor histidine kinase [Corynebacterium sp. TAE3-ERU30]MBV7302114.1 sensor histidine kinase [Corynebacterium sp. TAE3-ERU2]
MFLVGIIVGAMGALVMMPLARFLRRWAQRRREAETITDNRITTISQVLHLTVQGSPTGVAVIDRSGSVVLSNMPAHDMGIVHEHSVNKQIWASALEVFADQDTRVVSLELPRRLASRVSAVDATVAPLTLTDERFVVVYSTDESEHVRMESARRDFVANVSHELKTPVGGMALLAEVLLNSADDPESVLHFGERLLNEAHRMSSLINELIALSKLQGAEKLPAMKPVSVDEVIDEAVSRNKLTAETAGIEIIRDTPSGVQVRGDSTLLITAITNLIINAINYSPESTPVTISQKVVHSPSGEKTVQVRVTDRGIGISEEDQQRVFERFFRVDKARSRQTGGTGLGLAIVKHVTANHGGSIKLWSQPNIGSTFTLELPVFDVQETNEAQPLTSEAPELPADTSVAAPKRARRSLRPLGGGRGHRNAEKQPAARQDSLMDRVGITSASQHVGMRNEASRRKDGTE